MQTIELNMAALAVNDRRVGHITAVRRCCFQIQLDDQPNRLSLTLDSIFSVDTARVTLVCAAEEVRRYACPAHPA
jgi:hypothetical protein